MRAYIVDTGSRRHRVELHSHGADVSIDNRTADSTHVWLDAGGQNLLVILDGRSHDFRIESGDDQFVVLTYAGHRYQCRVLDEHRADLQRRAGIIAQPSGPSVVKAPMPGLVVKVLVEAGRQVTAGERLFVLEAMKMENDVKAPRTGTVQSINTAVGVAVEAGAALAVIV